MSPKQLSHSTGLFDYSPSSLKPNSFTQKHFYTRILHTETLFHRDAVTHRASDTQTSLHRNAFTHRPFYTQTLLQTDPFYTQTLLETDPVTHRPFYAHTRFFTSLLLLLLLLHVFFTGISKAKKRSFLKPKNRQFGGVFVFFEASRSKKHRKYRDSLRLASPKPRNYRGFCYQWPAPSKNSGIYAVFSMLQEVLFPCQKPKNTVNYSVVAFDTR